jgi:hypothetical protein
MPVLFIEEPGFPLSDREKELKLMLEDIFNRLLQHPYHTDSRIVEYVVQKWGLSKTQAYFYLNEVKPVLGNIKNSGKEFQRSRLITMLLEAYALAKRQKKPKEMAMAASALGKYTKLDKDEPDAHDWALIQAPNWEPSADLTLLNIPGLPTSEEDLSKLKQKLRSRYLKASTFDEAEIVE